MRAVRMRMVQTSRVLSAQNVLSRLRMYMDQLLLLETWFLSHLNILSGAGIPSFRLDIDAGT